MKTIYLISLIASLGGYASELKYQSIEITPNEFHKIRISETSNIYPDPGLYDVRLSSFFGIGFLIDIIISTNEKPFFANFPVMEILPHNGSCKLMSESGYEKNEKMIDVIYLKSCISN